MLCKNRSWSLVLFSFFVLPFLGGAAFADMGGHAYIQYDTAHYLFWDFEPNHDFIVEILDCKTNQASIYDHQSDGNGSFSGTGNPGSGGIPPGSWVAVRVYDDDTMDLLASITVQKSYNDKPWWAFDLMLTRKIHLIAWLISLLLNLGD